MNYSKNDFFNENKRIPNFLGFQSVSSYVQNKDSNSFDRIKLKNIIPTINGIDIQNLIII
jgi:hypothetical protein